MTGKVTCFLPCRAGSQRVVKKNIKPFAGHEHGLIQIKLRQLLAAKSITEVVLTTNDADILAYAESLDHPRLRLHRRVEELSSSATSTDQLVAHALELIPDSHILWTHVTSPFITAKDYDDVIQAYWEQREQGYDSLMTTTAIHGFLWQDEQPMNYDRTIEKWPRTQTLAPVHEVNSGAFLAPADLYRELNDRIGRRPYLYAMDKFTSFDIDWPEDFVIAECLVEKGLVTP
ncbi:acylneuraminate cytidylyltransferase family protein [Halomonas mongoliensis]|uniref:acylneuraminate cytidylyltransferase family protein n=1 Tax=Halomonas mongoliensis TaxID=321265 RepID=UPI00403ADAE7